MSDKLNVSARAREAAIEAVARRFCAEACAEFGDPPCYEIDPNWQAHSDPEVSCNCLALARVAADAILPTFERDLLEEAAKVAERWRYSDHTADILNADPGEAPTSVCRRSIAKAIRALSTLTPESPSK